jgi:lysophospholipase L1-like esterase
MTTLRKQQTDCLAMLAMVGMFSSQTAMAWAQAGNTASSTPVVKSTLTYPERTALWEKSVVTFEAHDIVRGVPAPGGVLFVGSSSIVNWQSLAADFPGIPVINRGFGGTEIQDSTYYAYRIVVPYRPRTVVFYAGDNDLAAGHTTEQVVGDFQTFARKIRAALPETKLIYLAIKPSPSRWNLEPQMLAVNRAISEWVRAQPNMTFVDVHSPMLGADGKPRPELYRADRLHMTPEGYRIWTETLAPHLR